MGKPSKKLTETTASSSESPPMQDTTSSNNILSTDDASGPELPQDKLDLILLEIKNTRAALKTQIGFLTTGLTLLRADHTKVTDTVKEHGKTLQEIQPRFADTSTLVHQLRQQITDLTDRTEDAEGRNRRNNIRVIGLPERSEGTKAAEFMEDWFKTVVAPHGLSPFFCIERAHRVPTGPPRPGASPRPLIVRILNYRDRDFLLQRARELGLIQFENHKISLYPDYTASVQKQRSAYQAVKRKLQTAHLKYALLFPARLKIIHDQKSYYFQNPAEAEEWIDVMGIGDVQDSQEVPPSRGSRMGKRTDGRKSQRIIAGTGGVGPTRSQQQKAKETALIVAATFREDSQKIQTGSDEDSVHSDSDHSITLLPSITPQTSDTLIDS